MRPDLPDAFVPCVVLPGSGGRGGVDGRKVGNPIPSAADCAAILEAEQRWEEEMNTRASKVRHNFFRKVTGLRYFCEFGVCAVLASFRNRMTPNSVRLPILSDIFS
jgi:hypothetical protein